MEIKHSEIDRILEFIFISSEKLREHYISKEDIIVSVPEYFFDFMNYKSKSIVANFNYTGDIMKSCFFGLKMQYNHENKITIFCKSMHIYKDIPKLETEINCNIFKI